MSTAAVLPASAQEAASCDYFRNSLIGTRCAQTVGVGAGVSRLRHELDYSSPFGGHSTAKNDYTVASASISFTPTHWLTLKVGSSYDWSSYHDTFNDGFVTRSWSGESSGVSRHSLGANVNVYDSGPSSARYVVNVYGNGYLVPSRSGGGDLTLIEGGMSAAALWRLGGSGYSLSAHGSAELLKATKYETVLLGTTARLLLSHDLLGLAFGPELSSSRRIVSNGSNNDIGPFYNLGAVVIAAPFQSSDIRLLRGMTLEGGYRHSLGLANSLPTGDGSAKSSGVSGAANFNFKY
jgi:hypothetical protein